MRSLKKSIQRLLFTIFLFVFIFAGNHKSILVQAQTSPEGWSQPVNLSRSGAASQPFLFNIPGNKLGAAWWDRFDRLVVSNYDGKKWTDGVTASISSDTLKKTPELIADNYGIIHAFWQAEESGTLFHSQLLVGAIFWSKPEIISISIVSYEAINLSSGGLLLAYIRSAHTPEISAGVYIQTYRAYAPVQPAAGGSTPVGGVALPATSGWSQAINIYPTKYFRLVTSENTYLQLAEVSNTAYIIWRDPRLDMDLYAVSKNGGINWSLPVDISETKYGLSLPRLALSPDGKSQVLFQMLGAGGCLIYRKTLDTKSNTASNTTDRINVDRILTGVKPCPQNDHFWNFENQLLWLWGEGGSSLNFVTYDSVQDKWTQPKSTNFNFFDSSTQKVISLSDLHSTVYGKTLVVIGSNNSDGEVWVTFGQIDLKKLTQSSQSQWSNLLRLSPSDYSPSNPQLVLDSSSRVHVVWSKGGSDNSPDNSLAYTRYDGKTWSRPIEIVESVNNEFAQQPAIAVGAQDLLHLVWSGGEKGQIFYSRAKPDQSTSSGGWSPYQVVSGKLPGSWPQIVAEQTGSVYIVFAVRLNEGRGIYLVRSDDNGLNWSEPVLVFDGVKAGWDMVDTPALAVSENGVLHVAWIKSPIPGTWSTQGIYYSYSTDKGKTWFDKQMLAGAGFEYPRLALVGGRIHMVYIESAPGRLWHRSIPIQNQTGSAWSQEAVVPGMENLANHFGLVNDGYDNSANGRLHLIGISRTANQIQYTYWENRWNLVDVFPLILPGEQGLAISASSLAQGKYLATVIYIGLSNPNNQPKNAIFFSSREIPSVDLGAEATPQPTAVIQKTLAIQVPSRTPSPTPDLTGSLVSSELGLIPQIMAALLAVIVIVAVLVMRAFWLKKQN